MEFKFITVDSPEYDGECEVRFKRLREPLGYSRDFEKFPFEGESHHLVAVDNGRVVGCILFHPESETYGRLYQIAVYEEYQGKGLGGELVMRMIEKIKRAGIKEIYVHVRLRTVDFFKKLGFIVEGEEFTEIGLPHRYMRKRL